MCITPPGGPVPVECDCVPCSCHYQRCGDHPTTCNYVTQDEILALKEWPQLMASQEMQELHSADQNRLFTLGANNQEGAEFS